jgi:hypothetical protein
MAGMSIRKALLLLSLIAALGCLGGGYLASGQWWGAVLVLILTLGWWFYSKQAWLNPVGLICLVALAALGVLVGAPPILMVPGAAAALAAWDLIDLERTMRGSEASSAARQFESLHVRWLLGALGTGLAIAVLGIAVSLQVPFIVLIGIIILDLYCLQRLARMVLRST